MSADLRSFSAFSFFKFVLSFHLKDTLHGKLSRRASFCSFLLPAVFCQGHSLDMNIYCRYPLSGYLKDIVFYGSLNVPCKLRYLAAVVGDHGYIDDRAVFFVSCNFYACGPFFLARDHPAYIVGQAVSKMVHPATPIAAFIAAIPTISSDILFMVCFSDMILPH